MTSKNYTYMYKIIHLNINQFIYICTFFNMKNKFGIRDIIIDYYSIVILKNILIFSNFGFRLGLYRRNLFVGFC